MEFFTAAAFNSILNSLTKSKGGQEAKDELSQALWQWIRPLLLVDEPDLVEEIEKSPDDEDLQNELRLKIKRKGKRDANFATTLEKELAKYRAVNESSDVQYFSQTTHGPNSDNIVNYNRR